jgi:site-specific recombinase XerD
MESKKPIIELFQSVFQALREWGLSEYSIQTYYYEGIRPILVYYEDAGKATYDEAFTNNVILDIKRRRDDGIVCDGIYKCTRKVAELLKSNNGAGFVWKRRISKVREDLKSAYYSELLNHYRSDEYRMGLRAAATIRIHLILIRHFLYWLENNAKETLEQISLDDVGEFLTFYGEQKPRNIGEMLGALRKFCAFIKRQNIIGVDFSPALIARPAKRSKLMPVFTQTEAEEILSAVDTTTSLGKRNYAILIIAKELGIRSCDIASLKLDDIRWENNEIRFRQAKTGAELVLPLEPVVGNAVADFILNGRPKTNTPYIFVRLRAPYIKMTAMSDIIRKYAPHGKFQKLSGFHSFRRGIASQMLNVGIAADTVKDILGHTKINSLKPYARISDVRLKSCAMSLSGIGTTREVLR